MRVTPGLPPTWTIGRRNCSPSPPREARKAYRSATGAGWGEHLNSLHQFGRRHFDVSRGESLSREFGGWVDRPTLDRWLDAASAQDFLSGDVYARLTG